MLCICDTQSRISQGYRNNVGAGFCRHLRSKATGGAPPTFFQKNLPKSNARTLNSTGLAAFDGTAKAQGKYVGFPRYYFLVA